MYWSWIVLGSNLVRLDICQTWVHQILFDNNRAKSSLTVFPVIFKSKKHMHKPPHPIQPNLIQSNLLHVLTWSFICDNKSLPNQWAFSLPLALPEQKYVYNFDRKMQCINVVIGCFWETSKFHLYCLILGMRSPPPLPT